MRCLETRKRPDGTKHRRYRAPDGRVIRTVEVPIEVWRGVAPDARRQARLQAWEKGQARLAKELRSKELLAAGWKPVAVAHELGLSTRTVERHRREMNK